jgi:putative ATP-dependent endonuclease of OLD family
VRGTTFEAIAQRIAAATGDAPQLRAGEVAKLHQVLQPSLNEMFFGDRIVLMEGAEDVAYVTAWMHLTGRWEEYRRRGVHLVPTNFKSAMLRPLAVLLELEMRVFVVFDSDGHVNDPDRRLLHQRDNLALLRALAAPNPVAFPALATWNERYAQWPTTLSDQVKNEIGAPRWATCCQRADQVWGHAGDLRKNAVHIGTSLRLARDDGGASPTLDMLCTHILA